MSVASGDRRCVRLFEVDCSGIRSGMFNASDKMWECPRGRDGDECEKAII